MAKAHLASLGLDLLPEIANHPPQQICAHVGLVLPQNVLWCPRRHKGLHDKGAAGIVGARGELAVGKGAGTALPKLDVGLRIEFPALPKSLHVLHPLLQGLATLQDNGR